MAFNLVGLTGSLKQRTQGAAAGAAGPQQSANEQLVGATKDIFDKAAPFRGLRTDFLTSLGLANDSPLVQRASGIAAGSVQQGMEGRTAGTTNDALDRAVDRQRGLSRLALSASEGVKGQRLQQRVGALGQMGERRAAGLEGVSQAARLESGLIESQRDAKAGRRSSQMGMLGTLAGAAGGMILDRIGKK